MPKKTPLVLVPGLLCNATLWGPQLDALDSIAEMFVPDLGAYDSVEAMARAVLAQAPERFALAGLSMGGYVTTAILELAPERVERAALLDTSARAGTPEQAVTRRALMDMVRAGNFEAVIRLMLERFIDPTRFAETALTKAILEMERAVGPEAFLRQQQAIIDRPNRLATLAASTCPMLLLCGDRDVVTPLDLHEEMLGARPDATFRVIADCGHLSTLERPAEVTAALTAWLSA